MSLRRGAFRVLDALAVAWWKLAKIVVSIFGTAGPHADEEVERLPRPSHRDKESQWGDSVKVYVVTSDDHDVLG